MQRFVLKKGLNVSISGVLEDVTITEAPVKTVAVLGDDYIGLKPRLSVAAGDSVVVGTPIFTHKDTPEVQIVSPVAGRIKAINRGARRKLISVEIEIDSENGGAPVDFSDVGDEKPPKV